MSKRKRGEAGAAAVEFALVLPLLLTLLMGVVEFGWYFFNQGTLAGAAREAARDFAIHEDAAQAADKAVQTATGLSLTASQVGGLACGADGLVTVTIDYTYDSLTGFFFDERPMQGTGSMRCQG